MFIDPTFSVSGSFFIGVGSCCIRCLELVGGVAVGSKLAVDEGCMVVAGMGYGKGSGTEGGRLVVVSLRLSGGGGKLVSEVALPFARLEYYMLQFFGGIG